MKIAAAAVALVLTACGGAQSTTLATLREELATVAPSSAAPSPSAEPAGIERMCTAFDIVTGTISPTYEELEDDPISLAAGGLAITVAGGQIRDLADGVEPAELARDIRSLGTRFQREGLLVQDGDLTDDKAISFYLDLVEKYIDECP